MPRPRFIGGAVQKKEWIRNHAIVRKVPASISEVEKASGKLPPNKHIQEVDDEVDPKDAERGARFDQNLTTCDDTEAVQEDICNQMETVHITQRIGVKLV